MPTTRGQAKREATAEPSTEVKTPSTVKTVRSLPVSTATSISTAPTPTPRKRGRPPKHPKSTPLSESTASILSTDTNDDKMSPPRLSDVERVPLVDDEQPPVALVTKSWAQRNQWLVYALASGACAAFNGVFAKLTTTELTTTLSLAIARLLNLEKAEKVVEVIVRGGFFGLNLIFNGIMWTLFTKALAKGNSTTQVTIMNTSFNFFITAILGFVIFSEALPPLWWIGAAMLVAGNVIVGAKDEGSMENGDAVRERNGGDAASISLSLADDEVAALRERERYRDREDGEDEDEDVLQDFVVDEDR